MCRGRRSCVGIVTFTLRKLQHDFQRGFIALRRIASNEKNFIGTSGIASTVPFGTEWVPRTFVPNLKRLGYCRTYLPSGELFRENGLAFPSYTKILVSLPSRNLLSARCGRYWRRMKSVAIIGASNDRNKYGNKAVRAFLQQGYKVYPLNLKETEIEGLPVFRSIGDVPGRVDMVSVYLAPEVLLSILPEIAAKGCGELWPNPGAESDEVSAEAERLGLNVIQACSIVGVAVSPSRL